ncbi:MAG: hypothetical protein A2Z17_04670 [Gammaproteobacteria bacterium RBG_16_66_13]|nr:MAG: hypothetical protein A2Z17_04670 [Gammaproteobacteria bacterium RBG_16_66_13]
MSTSTSVPVATPTVPPVPSSTARPALEPNQTLTAALPATVPPPVTPGATPDFPPTPTPTSTSTPSPSAAIRHTAVVERASRAAAAVIAFDQGLTSVPRYWPFGVRFQIVNEVEYSWQWEPALEWSRDGSTYGPVPQQPVVEIPFRLGEARNATGGQAIPPDAFVVIPGTEAPQQGVLYDSSYPARRQTLKGLAVTEVEFVVRATRDADWEGTYYFRLAGRGGRLNGGAPQMIIIAQRPPEPALTSPPAQGASASTFAVAQAESEVNPHQSLVLDTDTCAACHRVHTARAEALGVAASINDICMNCHDGTAANTDVLSEWHDPQVPPNDPEDGIAYSHPLAAGRAGTADDLAGQLERQAACTDCHNPHTLSGQRPSPTSFGWTAAGSLNGATGVTLAPTPYAWKEKIVYEYELCLKCHSAFTQLPSYPRPSQQKTDKLVDIDPTLGGSYHPVAGAGAGGSPELSRSLSGGTLWQFTTGDTVRCVNCHANYRALSGGAQPAASDRLAPHVSRYPSLLIAEYQRSLKPPSSANDYDPGQYQLCFLCHSPAPFADPSGDRRADTRFPMHGYHLNKLYDEYEGSASLSLDIDDPEAGSGNAICSECHFRIHSTRSAANPGDRNNSGLVNFAPNVLPDPESGGGPLWQPNLQTPASGSCTLLCHGQPHSGWGYQD